MAKRLGTFAQVGCRRWWPRGTGGFQEDLLKILPVYQEDTDHFSAVPQTAPQKETSSCHPRLLSPGEGASPGCLGTKRDSKKLRPLEPGSWFRTYQSSLGLVLYLRMRMQITNVCVRLNGIWSVHRVIQGLALNGHLWILVMHHFHGWREPLACSRVQAAVSRIGELDRQGSCLHGTPGPYDLPWAGAAEGDCLLCSGVI